MTNQREMNKRWRKFSQQPVSEANLRKELRRSKVARKDFDFVFQFVGVFNTKKHKSKTDKGWCVGCMLDTIEVIKHLHNKRSLWICRSCKKYPAIACRDCVKDVYGEGLEVGKKIGHSLATGEKIK